MLAQALPVLAGMASLIALFLGALFLVSPERGLAFATHRREQLPLAMANRFLTIGAIMAFSAFYGRSEVIAFVFAAAGFGALHDGWVYRQAGHPFGKHVVSGVFFCTVALMALIAGLNGEAAS